MNKAFLFIAFVAFLGLGVLLSQNCTGCTTTINSNAVGSYTVNSGQTVCVASGFNYTGNITLNGGTLCNEGTLSNVVFNTGTFNNYGNLSKSGQVELKGSNGLTINCYANSSLEFLNAFEVKYNNSSITFTLNANPGSLVVFKSFSSTKGNILINNTAIPNSKSGNAIITFNGVFDIANQTALQLNNTYGTVNFNKNVTLNGKENCSINNSGTLNLYKAFVISGNGQNSANVTITNNGILNVSNNTTFDFNNGNLNLNNSGTVNLTGALSISKDNNVINNQTTGVLSTRLGLTINRGELINNGNTFISGSLNLSRGILTNNTSGKILIGVNLSVSGNNSSVLNNGSIDIRNNFSNASNITLGGQSIISIANNFINTNGGTLTTSGTVCAGIKVANNSINQGTITGYVDICDATPPAGAVKIDNNTGTIGANVKYCECCTYATIIINGGGSICNGESATLSVTSTGDAAPISYSWSPGGANTASIVVSPTVNTIYTVTANYAGGCSRTASNSLSVTPNNLLIDTRGADSIVMPDTLVYSISDSTGAYNKTGIVAGGIKGLCLNFLPGQRGLNVRYDLVFSSPAFGEDLKLRFYLNGEGIENMKIYEPGEAGADANGYRVLSVSYYTTTSNTSTLSLLLQTSLFNYWKNKRNLVYFELKKKLEGSYYIVSNGDLKFKFDEQYATGSGQKLKYVIYDDYRKVVASSTNSNTNFNYPIATGDNRYYLDLMACGINILNGGNLNAGFFVLEITNEKSEKWVLRFKHEKTINLQCNGNGGGNGGQ